MDVRAKLFSLLLTASVLLFAGCTVGEYGPEGGTTTNNTTPDASSSNNTNNADETSFTVTVKPLAQSNNCTGCHGNQPPTLTSWAMLQAKYKTKAGAMILATKGAHQGSPYFNATDLAQIQNWIDGLSQ